MFGSKLMKSKIFLTIILLCLFTAACSFDKRVRQGNIVVDKVELFRSQKDKLPNSLDEIGVTETESGPIYYEKKSETGYILRFGKESSESVTYDSESKQWK